LTAQYFEDFLDIPAALTAWDFLRDLLLQILLGNYAASPEEQLASNVGCLICTSLTALARYFGTRDGKTFNRQSPGDQAHSSDPVLFPFRSPWTTSLVAELRRVLVAPHILPSMSKQLFAVGERLFHDLERTISMHLPRESLKEPDRGLNQQLDTTSEMTFGLSFVPAEDDSEGADSCNEDEELACYPGQYSLTIVPLVTE